ncbi:APC family permease [Burkholderia ubonensis]|uniref:APC family permease n=1 Tax=Burkholderia ubonensis TaxID=101571 RepID=UPI00075523F4|nr:APC family permease [Burkholderia ubonensis]KVT05274.1 amino acid permease [Burkholderia ubonensis]KVT16134.1 amino acid permease [Burkholderia ubonensis]KVT33096.1 amino acid permease [Burkholderia ubonensis]
MAMMSESTGTLQASPVTSEAPRALAQTLSVRDAVMITVSGVTPASSIFVIAPFAIQQAGSGAVLSFLLGGVLAFAFALCYAELSAAHRSAGGEYVMAKRVFGTLPGYLTFIAVLSVSVFIPAVLASGAAPYLNNALGTHFGNQSVALTIVLLGYVLGMLNIKTNAWITGAFLVIEIGVLMLIAGLGFGAPHRGADALIHPVVGSGGALSPATAAAIVPAIGTAIFCYNGFGSAVFLAEDLRGGNRNVAKAVLYSLIVILVVELVPLAAIVLGAPSLAELSKSADPIGYVVSALSNPAVSRVVSGGIFLSVFNAIIAIVITMGRLLYSSGRHALWSRSCNRAFSAIHPRLESPWLATLALAAPSAGLVFVSSLDELTAFTVDLLLLVYLVVGLAALASRFVRRDVEHHYRMPFWPVTPLVAVAGAAYTLYTTLATSATPTDLYIIAGLFFVALAMYAMWARHSDAFRAL